MFIFFVVLLAIYVFATVLTEVEKFGWATLLLIAGVVVAQFFAGLNILGWVKGHGVETVIYTVAYVGVGVAWSFIKWFSFLMAFRDKFRSYKEKFLLGLNPPGDPKATVPSNFQKDFEEYLGRQSSYRGIYGDNPMNLRPRAAKNKARIVSWMSLWPCSLIGTLLNDPVKRLFNLIFNWFKGLYQKMADKLFAKDLELK